MDDTIFSWLTLINAFLLVLAMTEGSFGYLVILLVLDIWAFIVNYIVKKYKIKNKKRKEVDLYY